MSSRDLLIIQDWKVISQIIDPEYSNTQKYWIEALPGFDENEFPFVVCSGWLTFNIINVRDMVMEPLIDPFGKNKKAMSQEGAFFIEQDFGFNMYFDTSTITDDGNKTKSLYRMSFKEDFISTLKTLGRLPSTSNTAKLDRINELENEVSKLKKALA